MARARNIKPGFFVNEYLGTCDLMEMVLFEGLWCLANREGRLENRPLRIKAQIFPYRNYSAQEISGAIQNLSSNGFLTLYEVDGLDYIEICNFTKHQNPHKNEKGGDVPPPPQTPESKGEKQDSSNYASAHEKGCETRDESCLRNDDSLNDEPMNHEPKDSSSPVGDSPDGKAPARKFPLKDGSIFEPEESYVDELKTAHPQLAVEDELRRARLWLISNPGKRKTKAGMKRFLTAWMNRQKPAGNIHHIKSRHTGLGQKDYSNGLIEGVGDDAANF